MKNMICCLSLFVATSVVAFDQDINLLVDHNIELFNNTQANPTPQHCGVQKLPIHELDNDIIIEVFTLRGCSPGVNHAEQYLMVLTIQDGTWKVSSIAHIGSDTIFLADAIKSAKNKFTLYGSVVMDNDAHCCPSGRTEVNYYWKNNTLYRK